VKIRIAADADIERVIELQRTWMDTDKTYGFVLPSREYIQERIGKYFFVAEEAGSVIGFAYGSVRQNDDMCIFDAQCDYLEIEDLYVLPDFRHQHIGGKLVDLLVATAKKHGINRCFIYSSVMDIDPVVSFYKKHGFKSWAVQMYRDDTK
jgi:N-acetylglutamate synthase-like GNAT family acetyltransferase